MVEVMQRRFNNNMDGMVCAAMVRSHVLSNPMQYLCVRTTGGFLIAVLTYEWWRPQDPICNVIVVCAEDGKGWDALALLRLSIEWARERKATVWRYESDTMFDIGPLMRRLGIEKTTPRYKLNLEVTNG
jgi:hypothetical protein